MIDYKKKYLDALERANSFQEKYGGDYAGYIFPELRESEDERIRKALIDALKATETIGELKFRLPYPTREKCIAYLEKQKEQKHPNGCFTCDEYKKGYEEGRRNGFTAGYNKAMKEQKQEWSEEDINDVIERLKLAYNETKNKMFLADIKRLKSLRPQPKQEWSEEDDNALKYLHELIGFGYSEKFMDAQTAADMREWVNKTLLNRVGKESLQPHWKPTEDQMKALLRVVDKARELHYTSIDGYDGYNELRSLYEQIKKLM